MLQIFQRLHVSPCFRFSIFVLEILEFKKKGCYIHWQCSQYLELNPTCDLFQKFNSVLRLKPHNRKKLWLYSPFTVVIWTLKSLGYFFLFCENVRHVMNRCTYASCFGVAEIFDIEEVMVDLTDNKPAHGHHETVCSGWASATGHCSIYLYQQCIIWHWIEETSNCSNASLGIWCP